MVSLLHSIATFAEISAMVSELMAQLDSIKELLVMVKMKNESIAACHRPWYIGGKVSR
jgi:hypothetical protein